MKGTSRATTLYAYRDKTRVVITPSTPAKCGEHLTNQGKNSNFIKPDFDLKNGGAHSGPSDFSLSSTIELKFHAKIIHNTDPCYPANDQKNFHVKRVW